MKESYTDQENASSAAASANEKQDSYTSNPPTVLQDLPEDDDEPPIRQPPTRGPEIQYLQYQFDDTSSHITVDVHPTSGSGGISLAIEKRPFDRDATELAQYLHTSLISGLDDSEAQNRLKLYGKNLLKGQGKVTIWAVLWRQVSNAMTVILLGALAIAFATEDFAEGGVIAGIESL
jgi:magnesium-transporting ATPase (P-type)